MTIRLASEVDYAFCAQMMIQTDPWVTLKMTFQQCLAGFSGPSKDIFVVEIEEKLAGFIVIQTCGTFRGYIQLLCVAEEFRGQGVGNRLLAYAEESIKRYSVNMFICVSEFNKGAIKLYEKFGFRQVGLLPDLVRQGFTEILLRKSFAPLLND